MPERKREHKAFPYIATKVDGEQGIVTSLVAVMGALDLVNDRIINGAFVKTISERAGKIRVLDQHNTDSILRVLGKPITLREIGRAELPAEILASYPDATGGLLAETQFFLDVPEGLGAFRRIVQGGVDSWSIGFEVISSTYVKELIEGKAVMVRHISGIRLYEYSPVLFPAQEAATTVSAKADGGESVDKESKEMGADGRPIQRFGDMLQGSIHAMFTQIADRYYVAGYMSRDERLALSGLIGSALDLLATGMPENVAMLECNRGYYDDYYLYALAADVETKAGRPMAQAKLDQFHAAIDGLMAVHKAVCDMGETCPMASASGDSDGSKGSHLKGHQPAQAGPDDAPPTPSTDGAGPDDAPPTSTEIDVAEIEIALGELALLEV